MLDCYKRREIPGDGKPPLSKRTDYTRHATAGLPPPDDAPGVRKWREACAALRTVMTAATFDHLFGQSQVIGVEDGTITVGILAMADLNRVRDNVVQPCLDRIGVTVEFVSNGNHPLRPAV